ncbi:MAG: MucB/RseB C-terminal domain-containing protein [Gammaproteobacteria bacterium]
MVQAMGRLNYEGTVVFFRNGKVETMKYVHAARQSRKQERLLSLNSPLREVVRDGDLVRCRYNDTQQVVYDHRPYERSFLVNFPENIDQLAAFYDFVLAGEEDVAMFPAYIIDIQPKDDLRYARRIWVEKLRFLPLKATLHDFSGAILEQVVFTEQHVRESLPFVEVKTEDAHQNAELARLNTREDAEGSQFVVTNQPSGFKEIYFAKRPMHNSLRPVEHLLMSDGLASVSIYLENKNPEMESGLRSVGAVNSYSRNIDDFQVTVMGEVPPLTVKSIAEGIGLKGDER